uniref:Uncharacterized protein n=1 Tax=Arundo donax TaxID=35708 RepID=A0A0A9FUG0_ARUDO
MCCNVLHFQIRLNVT